MHRFNLVSDRAWWWTQAVACFARGDVQGARMALELLAILGLDGLKMAHGPPDSPGGLQER